MSLRRRCSNSWLNCRRPYPRTESRSGLWSILPPTFQFRKDRIQQRFAEQTIDTPGISLAEKIVEGPGTQTQQVVNTSVQHDVNTLEVEKHIIQEKIDQVTRHVETSLLQIGKKTFEVPELQFTDKVVDSPFVAQRQIRMNRKVQKTMEIHQLQHTDDVVDVPAVLGST